MELAEAYVQIIPSVNGLSKAISSEVGGSNTAVKSAGTKIGASLSNAVKAAFGKLKIDTAKIDRLKSSVVRAEQEMDRARKVSEARAKTVQSAEERLAMARQRAQAASEKVTVAEKKLGDALSKYGQGSQKAQAAQEQLTRAISTQQSALQRAESANKRLEKAQTAATKASGEYVAAQSAAAKATGELDAATKRASSRFQQMKEVAKSTGKSLGTFLTNSIKSVGKASLIAGAAASTAISGLIIQGGFARALKIEQAQAKLKGLGHDAKSIASIMGSANAAVKGTSFGLDAAATAAAGLSAAGVKSGKDLTAALTSVADVAQISGRSFEDIGTIFGSIAARGKLQGDDMLQLMSSGVPVLQMLGKQLGKTSAEVSGMVSKGEIDFGTFQKAMEAGLGGAAKSAGSTFSGALANVRAALSRLGQKGASPVLEGLRRIFVALAPAIDQVTIAISPLIDLFGQKFLKMADAAAAGINQFTAYMQSLDGQPLQHMIGMIPLAVLAFSKLAGAIFAVKKVSGFFRKSANDAAEAAKNTAAVGEQAEQAGSKLSWLSSKAAVVFGFFPKLATRATQALGKIPAVLALIPGKFAFVALGARKLQTVIGKIPGLFVRLGAGVGRIGGLFARFGAVLERVPGLFAWIIPLVSRLGVGLSILGRFLLANPWIMLAAGVAALGAVLISTGGDVSGFTNLVNGFIEHLQTAVDMLPGIIEAITAGLVTVVTSISTLLPSLVTSLVQGIVGIVAAITGVLPTLAAGLTRALVAVVTGLTQALVTMLPALIQAGVTLFTGLTQALVQVLPVLTRGIVRLITGIAAVLPTLTGALIGGALLLFQGLIQAVTQILPVLIQAFIQMFTSLEGALIQVLPALIKGVVGLIAALAAALPQLVGLLVQAAITLFMGLVKALPQILPPLIVGFVQLVMAIQSLVPSLIPVIIQAATSLFIGLVQGLIQVIPPLLAALPQILGALIAALIAAIPQLLQAAGTLFMAIIQALMKLVPQLLAALGGLIAQIFGQLAQMGAGMLAQTAAAWGSMKTAFMNGITAVIGFVASLPGRAVAALAALGGLITNIAVGAWNGFKGAVNRGITNVISIVRNLPGKILAALGDLGSLLVDSGRSLLEGLWKGISGAVGWVKDKISGALGSIRKLFPFSPAKEGPFSGRGWVLYSGLSIGEAMADGIARSAPAAVKSARMLTALTQEALDTIMPAPRAAMGVQRDLYAPGVQANGQQRVVYQTNTVNMVERDPRLVFRQMRRELEAVL